MFRVNRRRGLGWSLGLLALWSIAAVACGEDVAEIEVAGPTDVPAAVAAEAVRSETGATMVSIPSAVRTQPAATTVVEIAKPTPSASPNSTADGLTFLVDAPKRPFSDVEPLYRFPVPQFDGLGPEAGGERNPNDEMLPLVYFQNYGVNPFVDADEDPRSTFSLDGDTASFEVATLYLENGHLPPPDSVRVEEFVNAFDQGYPAQETGLGLHLDATPSPFGPEGYVLLRVGVSSARWAGPRDRVSIIFLVDVSGSMENDNRLEVAKEVMVGIADRVTPADRIGLVTYGDTAMVLHEMTGGVEIDSLLGIVRELQAGGSTFVADGIMKAYQLARAEMQQNRKVRIVLFSDGVANVGHTGPESILDLLDEQSHRDATLTAIGVGIGGNYNDVLLEALANRGNGTYHYIRGPKEAERFLAEHVESVFREVARDARIQVEFNPDVVRKYRLIGYENRAVADEDFRDDTLDFGELGFARDVTAFYELRLQPEVRPTGWLARGVLRWKDGITGAVTEVDATLDSAAILDEFDAATPYFQRAAAVVEFAELLRKSYWAQCGEMTDVAGLLELMDSIEPEKDWNEDVANLRSMVQRAVSLFEPFCTT